MNLRYGGLQVIRPSNLNLLFGVEEGVTTNYR